MFLIIFSFLVSSSLFCSEQLTTNLKLWESDYHNFNVTKSLRKNLAINDSIELNVLNTTDNTFIFFLVFEDHKSQDYWSKLNFKSTIVPGSNLLSFDLKRFVGERGSIKHQRSLDFGTLKKMYVVINPEEQKETANSVIIKSIILKQNLTIKKPGRMRAFKFLSKKTSSDIPSFFTKIYPDIINKKNTKSGFTDIHLWRASNSQTSPEYLSETLGVFKAKLKIILPPGEYEYELNWNDLGYWDVPFWTNRMFFIDSVPILKETRSSMNDFFEDYLQFMNEPPKGVHPYDYYIKKIFKPHKGQFTNKKSFVSFSFEGDETGVSLNTLYIWPKEIKKEVQLFMKDVDQNNKAQFNQKFRPLEGTGSKCELTKKIKITGTRNGLFSSDLCVDSSDVESISFKINNLKSDKNIIKKGVIKLSSYLYQFKSVDLNHETYQADADFLEPMVKLKVLTNGYSRRLLYLKLQGNHFSPGTYKGNLNVIKGKSSFIIPIEVTVLKSQISKLPINIGVLGLTPLGHLYFNGPDKNEFDGRFYKKAYSLLQQAGLNLFTGMPSPQIEYDRPSYKKFHINSLQADNFLKNIKGKELFFYNEDFPSKIFLGNERNSSQSKDMYFKNLKKELDKFSKKHSSIDMFYLYSDEATGYRNAVESDKAKIKHLKKVYPSLKLGGFGNLYDWAKGKSLYQKWDFGLYSDLPDQTFIKKLKNQQFGLYNLCAEPTKDLSFCFGLQLYLLYKAGIKYYFEWHASAIHNYPGFDLDGREADIGFFYPGHNGDILVTKRYTQAARGIEIFRKFLVLDRFIQKEKTSIKAFRKALKWLSGIQQLDIFPVKPFYKKNYNHFDILKRTLDSHLIKLNL